MEKALQVESLTMSPATQTFESFYRSHYTRLAQALLLLTRSEALAEDLAQEACARVLSRWDRVREMDSPDGYLFRTALNLFRKKARRPELPIPPISGLSPDHAAPVAERDRVLRALEALSRRQREAVVLVDWLDMATEDAARVLGLQPSSVRVRLHRARATLRDILGGSDE
jgi:RNA polymerase sigma-70 factor (ECF subfamily)